MVCCCGGCCGSGCGRILVRAFPSTICRLVYSAAGNKQEIKGLEVRYAAGLSDPTVLCLREKALAEAQECRTLSRLCA